MPRKTTPPAPPPKEWTLAAINSGIAKLKRRIEDIRAVATENVTRSDPRVVPLEAQTISNIEDIFGTGSREHQRYQHFSFQHYGVSRKHAFGTPEYIIEKERQQNFQRGVQDGVETLHGLIKQLEEIREEFSKCPKCGWTFRNLDYCTQDGSHLVSLDYDPQAPTMHQ